MVSRGDSMGGLAAKLMQSSLASLQQNTDSASDGEQEEVLSAIFVLTLTAGFCSLSKGDRELPETMARNRFSVREHKITPATLPVMILHGRQLANVNSAGRHLECLEKNTWVGAESVCLLL